MIHTMRVLMLNQVFHPDVAATAQHAHDLGKHLVAHGHEVTVIASRSLYGEKGATLPRRETVDGIEVYRVGRSFFGKASIAARALDFGYFYLAATLRALSLRRHDVAITFTTPPFIALVGWLLRLVRGTRWVYWVMDLYPDVPIVLGLMRERSLPARFFERLNRFCLRRADRSVVLGRCMRQRVLGKGVPERCLELIGVWSDAEELAPPPRNENPYRREWDLGDRFVVMYSGNFGISHDVETMLGAAERLKDDGRIRFAFVGGGKKKAVVERFVAERGLGNCVTAPYQPRDRLGASLSCADLHLASLLEGAEGVMVPCKLFGIMAAGRPCAFVGHESSEVARVLSEHDAGFVVRQGDVDRLVEIIDDLAANREKAQRLGENARRALGAAYDRSRACEAWRVLLEEVVSGQPRAEAAEPEVAAPDEERVSAGISEASRSTHA